MVGVVDHLEVWDRDALAGRPGRAWTPRSRRSRRALAILLDMTRTHVPVLAGELIDLLDPRPARSRWTAPSAPAATRAWSPTGSGPTGTLDLHRPRPGRRGALRRVRAPRSPCETRFLRMDFAEGLRAARRRGRRGRPRLPGPRRLLDAGRHARARLLLLLRRAARHAHGPRPGARRARGRERRGTSAGCAQLFRRYGEERYARRDRARDRAPARARAASRPRPSWSRRSRPPCPPPGAVRRRPPGQARLPGDPDRRQRRARARSTARCPRRGTLLRPAAGSAAISFHSLEDRRVKRFLVDRARGCICPPDFPVCVCGREPEAELLTRRAVAPTPGEIAAQPARQVRPAARRAQARGRSALMPRGRAAAAGGRRGRPRAARARPRAGSAARAARRGPAPLAAGRARRTGAARRAAAARAPRPACARAPSALLDRAARAAAPGSALVGSLLVGIVFFNVERAAS